MRKLQLFVVLIVALVLTGCSAPSIPGLVPAEGIVLLDGQPVEGVSIVFTPSVGSEGDRHATAISQNDGRFVLHTVDYRGALPGRYNVVLSKTTSVTTVSDEEAERLSAAGRVVPSDITYHIPWKYGDVRLSGIVIEVDASGNREIRIELQSDDTPPPRSLI